MPTISFKLKRKRKELTKRYSCVAYELPGWAKEALTSKMGDVVVSAQESYEIFLNNKQGIKPKDEYKMFCKKFAEIFQNRAAITLKKIISNRNKQEDFYISNDYFWQEFSHLFTVNTPLKNKIVKFLEQVEKNIFIFFKKSIKKISDLFSRILKSIWITVARAKLSGKMIKAVKKGELHGN